MVPLISLASGGPWDGAIGGIQTVYSSIGHLLMVTLGIGASVVFVLIILQFIQGDRDSVKKLLLWLLSLAVGFTLLLILQRLKH